MPITSNKADVIVSNCVLNLVPDKVKAFKEIIRVLKPGGHFSVSDIVTSGKLPQAIKSGAELYAGCVGGAVTKDEYLGIIKDAGFIDIKVQKERVINVPEEIYLKFISKEDFEKFKASGVNIVSINVYADKPECNKGSGCC